MVIGDVDERAEETVDSIAKHGGIATFVKTDVTQPQQVKALVSRTVELNGGLDIAFNNAGILPPTAPLIEQSDDDWNRVIGVDLTGLFHCLKHELGHMVPKGRGSIINTASVAGLVADPGMAPYVAAKHAVVGLTRAAALDYADMGVRVNAVAPGLIRTPMTERWLDDPEISARILADSPVGRAAEPDEVAGIVLFLASGMSSAVTGSIYTVDGGRTAH